MEKWIEIAGGPRILLLTSYAEDPLAPALGFAVEGVSDRRGAEFSERVRAWEGQGDFAQTLARWLAGDQPPPGLGLRTRLDGTLLQSSTPTSPAANSACSHGPVGRPDVIPKAKDAERPHRKTADPSPTRLTSP